MQCELSLYVTVHHLWSVRQGKSGAQSFWDILYIYVQRSSQERKGIGNKRCQEEKRNIKLMKMGEVARAAAFRWPRWVCPSIYFFSSSSLSLCDSFNTPPSPLSLWPLGWGLDIYIYMLGQQITSHRDGWNPEDSFFFLRQSRRGRRRPCLSLSARYKRLNVWITSAR